MMDSLILNSYIQYILSETKDSLNISREQHMNYLRQNKTYQQIAQTYFISQQQNIHKAYEQIKKICQQTNIDVINFLDQMIEQFHQKLKKENQEKLLQYKRLCDKESQLYCQWYKLVIMQELAKNYQQEEQAKNQAYQKYRQIVNSKQKVELFSEDMLILRNNQARFKSKLTKFCQFYQKIQKLTSKEFIKQVSQQLQESPLKKSKFKLPGKRNRNQSNFTNNKKKLAPNISKKSMGKSLKTSYSVSRRGEEKFNKASQNSQRRKSLGKVNLKRN